MCVCVYVSVCTCIQYFHTCKCEACKFHAFVPSQQGISGGERVLNGDSDSLVALNKKEPHLFKHQIVRGAKKK